MSTTGTLTIADLKNHLRLSKLSPEQLAKTTGISNMTIRRLLKREPGEPLPAKYALHFQALRAPAVEGFDTILAEVERTGQKPRDLDELRRDLDEKLKDTRIAGDFRAAVEAVSRTAFGKLKGARLTRNRALAIGALLYLVNPLDLIPDALGPVGYLDDFAVISLVAGMIKREETTTS